MDKRCKSELWTSYMKCKQEEHNIVTLIKEILLKQKVIIDNVDLLNEQKVIQHCNVILDSTQMNYMLFNKLFSIYIDLDTFWKRYKEQAHRNILDFPDEKYKISAISASVPQDYIDNAIEDIVQELKATEDYPEAVASNLNKNLSDDAHKISTEIAFCKNEPKGRFERKFEHVITELPNLSFVKVTSSSAAPPYRNLKEKTINEQQNKVLEDYNELITEGYALLEELNKNEQNNDHNQPSSRSFMEKQIKQAQGLGEITEQDDELAALDKFCNTMPEIPSTMADALMGYNAKDDSRLCKFVRNNGTCFKGTRCKREHIRRKNHGITTDTEEVFLAPENTYMPSVNEVLTVNIRRFKTPSLLYGQVQHADNGNGTLFKNMFKQMNKNQLTRTYETFEYPPAIGELVIAKNFDDRWYRAIVMGSNVGTSVKGSIANVFFVDIGEEANISLPDLRKMKSAFVNHPYQALLFRVSNVEPAQTYDLLSFQEFASKFLYTNLTITVRYAGADFICGVFTDESGNDLATALIESKFAMVNTVDIYPLRSSNILLA